MLEAVKYEHLKKETKKYEVMLLRDLYAKSFPDIAKEYGLSLQTTIQYYYYAKIKQARLYIRHLSIVHGYDKTKFFHDMFVEAEHCYEDWQYAVAYLEKSYKTILDEYRDGEPGMPADFLAKLPPLRKKWGPKMMLKIVTLREVEKKTFIEIGRKLNITRYKAEKLYDHYYADKYYEIINELKEKLGDIKGNEISNTYERRWHKAKKLYDWVCRDYPEYVIKQSLGCKDNTPRD